MGTRLVSPTFVGRRDALEVGDDVLRRIADGQPSHLLIGGEAGIGKTRLSGEIAGLAGRSGFTVLQGGCIALSSGELPYAPLAEALRGLARRMDRTALDALVADDGPILRRVAAELGGEGRDGGPATSEPGHGEGWERAGSAARGRLLGAVLRLVGRLAASGPLLIVIEDLHWADSASLDTLSFLLRSLRAERVGLLLTFRSDELSRRHPLVPWLGELERSPTVARIELGPLSQGETAELIRGISGSVPSTDVVARIHDRSDGNPFFTEELVAFADASEPARLTPTLHDVLTARVQALPGESQVLIGVAAVAGRRTDVDLLAQVQGVAPDDLDAPLTACLDRGVLVLGDGERGARVAFRHALIHELVYERLLPGERIRLHRRFAEVLSARALAPGADTPGRWAELAHHWDAARDEPRALESAIRAAGEAERAGAYASALAQYRRGLAGWGLVTDPASIAGFDHVELLSRAARAAWLCGREMDAEAPLLRAAIEEADSRDDDLRCALLSGRLGFAQAASGDPDLGRRTYVAAMDRLPAGAPPGDRARMLAGYAQVLLANAEDDEGIAVAEEAVATARVAGDRRTEGHALDTLACFLSTRGQGALAIETIERARGIALELGDPDEIGRAYANAVEILGEGGRDAEARALVRPGLEKTNDVGVGDQWGFAIRTHGAVVAFGLGEWGEAASLLAGVPFDALDPGSEAYALARAVELAVATGASEDARSKLARLRALLAPYRSDYQHVGPFACARAELALWRPDPGLALETISEDLGRLERTPDVRYRMRLLRLGLRACADLAAVARDRRDVDEATKAAAVAAGLRVRTAGLAARVDTMDGGLALEMAAEQATTRAEETRLAGASDPAAWGEAAARWLARGWPYQRGYALWRQSEASLAHGDRRAALQALQDAGEIAARLGAVPLLKAITALSRRARLPLELRAQGSATAERPAERETAAANDGFGLTPRERDVLELVAQGMTNRQIADALFISVYTAGLHVSRILGKLDASSRTEAAAKAYRLGLVAR